MDGPFPATGQGLKAVADGYPSISLIASAGIFPP